MPEDPNAFGLRPDFRPRRLPMRLIAEALGDAPDPTDLDMELEMYLEGLAAACLQRLEEGGFEVGPVRGQASWVWNPDLNVHVPTCSAAGCAVVLGDPQVIAGRCGEHDRG